MDSTLLLDLCVAVATALCVALFVYGIWLCLPEGDPETGQKAKDEGARSEAGAGAPKIGEL